MRWLTEPVIDDTLAALLAEDMLRLAHADGHLHPRELALVEAFASQVPEGVTAADATLDTPELRVTYVRSLVILALSDGSLAPEESAMIESLAGARGIEASEVARITHLLKLQFYGAAEERRAFRASLRAAAAAWRGEDEAEGLWH